MTKLLCIATLVVSLLGCSGAQVDGECHVAYRDDGDSTEGHRRYYAVLVCESVLCDSAAPLPEPATKTGGCR